MSSYQYDSPAVYDTNQIYDAYAASTTPTTTEVLCHLDATLSLQADGTFAFLVQNTIAEVAQSVEMICGTVIGDRTVVPTFGLTEQAFTEPNKTYLVNQINQFEDRAVVSITVDNQDNGISKVNVAVALARGNTP